MRKRLVSALCVAVMLALAACGESTSDNSSESYTAVNADALWGAQYENTRIEVLSYEFEDNFHSYADVDDGPAVVVRFYFQNDGEDPLYLLESYGIYPYQDGTELDYISLNSDDEECTNVSKAVKDGAGIFCKMAFSTTSDSDVELQISEPTADADLLGTINLTK